MSPLTFLQQRNSASRLCAPGPDAAQLREIFAAAGRAPDHARLMPWRFRIVEGDSRAALGELFLRAARQREAAVSDSDAERYLRQPLRAPLILVVSAVVREHPKVPPIEQIMSAACAAHAALLAAEALGFAGIWRTGAHAFDAAVRRGLGMAEDEQIVGFLYIGSREGPAKSVTAIDPAEFVQQWTTIK